MSLTIATEELLIGGKRTPAADGKTYETLNPATSEVLARVADAGVEDAERAIRAARTSFDEGPWRQWPGGRRRKVLLKVAALINERTQQLAELACQCEAATAG